MADKVKKVIYHTVFLKHYRQRIEKHPQLVRQFRRRFVLFMNDRQHRLLRDHRLTGDMLDKRSFSISGDIRVVYREHEGVIEFMDIGTHNQVY